MKIIEDNPVILVDGSFYIHRAYHAFPPLTTTYGTHVWVIYGVISMIRSLLLRYRPTDMGVIFDTSGKTFRNDIFKEYKANRIKIPQDLYNQIDPLYLILRAMGIAIFNIPDVEADDVIATLATYHAKKGKLVLISTGDKDIAQIVSSRIFLINTMSNIVFDIKEIKNKFGVSPVLIPDYLALVGDRVDNIPGVSGIGKKTASVLLTQIGNLELLYKNLHNIPLLSVRNPKMIQNSLVENKEIVLLSRKLVSLKLDVPLIKEDYELSIRKANYEQLLSLFKKYEFNNWFKELQSGMWLNGYEYCKSIIPRDTYFMQSVFNPVKKISYRSSCINSQKTVNYVINNVDLLSKWLNKIDTVNLMIFNIYTDTFNVFTAKIASLCLSIRSGCVQENVYIPIITNSTSSIDENYLFLDQVLCVLKPILENPKIRKLGQNMKFSHSLLNRHGINFKGIAFDIVLEFYILYGTVDYQNVKQFLDSDTLNAIINFKKFYDGYYDSFCIIGVRDVQLELSCIIKLIDSIFDLHQILWQKIRENSRLKKIFEVIEIPLISVLSRIERYGVLIDKDLLSAHSEELNCRLNKLKVEAHQLSDITFNLDSPKQLQDILYNQQKLPILKKTPHGAPSTSEDVLRRLSKQYVIPRIILKYRSLSKLKSTYTNKLITMINKKSSRIHTSYNQVRTVTGRLSSANPNLQNIPNRNHDGRKIRQAFVAPANFLIVSADYSQIELRIMAHLSHDFKLISDFLSGKDIHATTASEIFVTALHLVTNEQRHLAKTINFGLIYGMSAFGLARQLSVTCKEAQKYVDRYFQRYPGVMQYMRHIKDDVNRNGYVSTLDGRKLYLPAIYSTDISQKKSAERAAINAPMQGSAADIIKRAMVSIDYWLQSNNIPARMIMQVHDELVFEVRANCIDVVVKQIKKLMEECFVLDVPLKVDIGIGKNWEQAH